MYYRTPIVKKTRVAQLKFPLQRRRETWVTDARDDPVFMGSPTPPDSLACELCRLLSELRGIIGEEPQVTVLTWRKGPDPDLPAEAFPVIECIDDRGSRHEYNLADTTVELGIS